LDYVLSKVQDRAESGAANCEDLLALLKTLSELNLWPTDRKQRLLIKAKSRYMNGLYWAQDFQLFCNFIEAFPSAVVKNDLEAVRAQFLQFVSEPPLSDATNPDEIRGEAYVIEEVAGALGIDASKEIEDLNWLADGLEEEQRSDEHDEPDDDDDYRPISLDEDGSDSDVDSLFSTLEL
jgi:hypothetical protein